MKIRKNKKMEKGWRKEKLEGKKKIKTKRTSNQNNEMECCNFKRKRGIKKNRKKRKNAKQKEKKNRNIRREKTKIEKR